MASKTLKDMLVRVLEDLDFQNEDFASQQEAIRLINAGISECEATIHRLNEDYFLTFAPLALVQGQDAYALPDGIYAHKIRNLIYNDSQGRIYEIRRIKNYQKFLKLDWLDYQPTQTQDLRWLMTNELDVGPRIVFAPPAQETSSSNVKIWFLRAAKQLVNLTDVCDIPEFFEYIVQFAKAHLAKKEMNPNAAMEWSLLERQRKIMEDTLANMVPDDDTEIEQDLDHYNHHV